MRTLLIGLNDEDDNVRNTIEKVIVVKMDINNVIEYFSQNNQLNSLKISIKDILEKNKNLSMFTVNYFYQLIDSIEKFEKENNYQDGNFEVKNENQEKEYNENNNENDENDENNENNDE
jgi:hypothetical protein